VAEFCEHGGPNEAAGSVKGSKFIGHLSGVFVSQEGRSAELTI
jgi:hypothetical protein